MTGFTPWKLVRHANDPTTGSTHFARSSHRTAPGGEVFATGSLTGPERTPKGITCERVLGLPVWALWLPASVVGWQIARRELAPTRGARDGTKVSRSPGARGSRPARANLRGSQGRWPSGTVPSQADRITRRPLQRGIPTTAESIFDPAPSARRGRLAEAGISRELAKRWLGKTRLRPDVLDIFSSTPILKLTLSKEGKWMGMCSTAA
jgi:hypothetical protein